MTPTPWAHLRQAEKLVGHISHLQPHEKKNYITLFVQYFWEHCSRSNIINCAAGLRINLKGQETWVKLNLDIILKCSSDMLLTFLLGTFSHLCFSAQSSMQFWKMMQAVYHDIPYFYVVFLAIFLCILVLEKSCCSAQENAGVSPWNQEIITASPHALSVNEEPLYYACYKTIIIHVFMELKFRILTFCEIDNRIQRMWLVFVCQPWITTVKMLLLCLIIFAAVRERENGQPAIISLTHTLHSFINTLHNA